MTTAELHFKFESATHKMTTRRIIVAIALLAGAGWLLADWGNYHWEEEIELLDGGTLWVKRTTNYQRYGEITQLGHPSPYADGFEFKHPTTGKRIAWPLNGDVAPLMLDFDQGTTYLVTLINGGIAYRRLGCPPHRYAFYRYVNDRWERIDVRALPARFERANMVPELDHVTREMVSQEGRKMDARFTRIVIHGSGVSKEVQVIDRRYINPRNFCDGSINDIYGKGVSERLRKRFGANPSPSDILSEQEAIEFGIINRERTNE